MERSLKLTAIGLTSLLSTLLSLSISPIEPAQANPVEAQQVTAWRFDLHQSYCAGNWTEAISLAGAMMGSSEVRPHERLWLFLLRQDMFNFQRGVAEFSGCQGGRVLAGITAVEQEEIEPTGSTVNWNRAVNGFTNSQGESGSNNATRTLIATITDIVRGDQSDLYRRYAIGTVTNTGSAPVSYVEVIYDALERNEGYLESVESGREFVDSVYLYPGETTSFRIGFNRGQTIRISAINAVETRNSSNACYPRQNCDRPIRAADNTRY